MIEVEKASFVPLVFSTTGAMGKEAVLYHKQLATLLSKKRSVSYSEAMAFVRCKLRFCILKTTLIALRGYRGSSTRETADDEEAADIDLIPQEAPFF